MDHLRLGISREAFPYRRHDAYARSRGRWFPRPTIVGFRSTLAGRDQGASGQSQRQTAITTRALCRMCDCDTLLHCDGIRFRYPVDGICSSVGSDGGDRRNGLTVETAGRSNDARLVCLDGKSFLDRWALASRIHAGVSYRHDACDIHRRLYTPDLRRRAPGLAVAWRSWPHKRKEELATTRCAYFWHHRDACARRSTVRTCIILTAPALGCSFLDTRSADLGLDAPTADRLYETIE